MRSSHLLAFGILAAVILSILTSVLGINPLRIGEEHTKGTVLSIERSLIKDCMKISQTTQGESSVVHHCIYGSLPEIAIGDKVEFTYHRAISSLFDSMDFQ